MKNRIIVFIMVVIVLIAVLSILSSNPILSCTIEVPAHHLDAVKDQSRGMYSDRLPLVPVYVSVDAISGQKVFYTIYYFPFGTVGMSYADGDGYNIEKPLTGA